MLTAAPSTPPPTWVPCDRPTHSAGHAYRPRQRTIAYPLGGRYYDTRAAAATFSALRKDLTGQAVEVIDSESLGVATAIRGLHFQSFVPCKVSASFVNATTLLAGFFAAVPPAKLNGSRFCSNKLNLEATRARERERAKRERERERERERTGVLTLKQGRSWNPQVLMMYSVIGSFPC